MYRLFFKPIIDVFLSFVGIVMLFPLFLLIVVFLALTNQGNPFFLQKRPGKSGKIFTIIKFKTMNNKKDENGNLLPDAGRLTKFLSCLMS